MTPAPPAPGALYSVFCLRTRLLQTPDLRATPPWPSAPVASGQVHAVPSICPLLLCMDGQVICPRVATCSVNSFMRETW